MNATIISIGDELLIGQTINTNASMIARKIAKAGVSVNSILTIGDTGNAIREAVAAAQANSDIAIVTGGLGPTHDDLTKDVLVKHFGGKLVLYPEILKALEARFEQRGYRMPENNRGQAMLPDNAKVLPNKVGTAQGMLFQSGKFLCFVLPGVPYEASFIMDDSIVPMLSSMIKDVVLLHQSWRTVGVPESVLAEKIGDIAAIEEHGKLAFLPKYSGVDLRISVRAANRAEAETRIRKSEKIIRAKVGHHIYGSGDESLAGTVGAILRERSATLAVAESCTGGLLCARLTSEPGSSDFFVGGMVTYSNAEKIRQLGVREDTLKKHGAVSEEVALEMSVGARHRLQVDFAISTTGIAGPGGGSAEKPVGTVWIGFASAEKSYAKKYTISSLREVNQERSVNYALAILLRELAGRS